MVSCLDVGAEGLNPVEAHHQVAPLHVHSLLEDLRRHEAVELPAPKVAQGGVESLAPLGGLLVRHPPAQLLDELTAILGINSVMKSPQ